MSEQTFVSMAPHPDLVRTALAHCEIPLDYTNEGGVDIPAQGCGWDSNGRMTVAEGSAIHKILSAVITVAMVKHIEDTMVLPSNVSRIRQQASFLDDIAFSMQRGEDREAIEGIVETLRGVADNLDPANR